MDLRRENKVCIIFGTNVGKSIMEKLECPHKCSMVRHLLMIMNIHRGHQFHNDCTVATIWHLICEDQCQTIFDLADDVGISYETCQWILTAHQKQQHVKVCEEFLQATFDNTTLLYKLLQVMMWTGFIESKQQFFQRKRPTSPRS